MKAKNGFNLREVCGEHIIVAEGDENIDFSNIISMNESSAYLWKEVQKMASFTVEDIVELICDEYEIDEHTAHEDAVTLAAQWAAAGIIEGEDIPEGKIEALTPESGIAPDTSEPKRLGEDDEPVEPRKKGFFKRIFG